MDVLKVAADFLLPIVATLLLAVLVPLARKLGAVLAAKADAETRVRVEQLLEQLAIQGTHYAEEQGRKALRAGEPRPSGADKLELALGYVQERLSDAGVVDLAATQLRELIESRLHYERPELEAMALEEKPAV